MDSTGQDDTAQDNTVQYMTGQLRPGHAALLEAFQREGDAAVDALHPALDLPYGTGPRETFDFFAGTGAWRGTLAYFHAGYWQSRDKAQFRFLAPAFLAHGIDVALVNYPLCPDVTLAALVAATRQSVPAVLAHAAARERGGARLIAAGHSAGGHLAVELALAGLPIAGVVALSGVFDLAPLLNTPLNARLGLDAATARAASPVHRVAGGMPPALFIVGAAETPAFLAQNAAMHRAWAAAGNPSVALVVEGADHFSVLRTASRPGTALTRILGLFGP